MCKQFLDNNLTSDGVVITCMHAQLQVTYSLTHEYMYILLSQTKKIEKMRERVGWGVGE